MEDAKRAEFSQRVQRISRQHRKLSRGHVATIAPTGLIELKPQRKSSGSAMRSLLACLVVLMGFKGFLYNQIGETAYGLRILQLQNGSVLEKIGASVMYPDPITVTIAGVLSGRSR